MARNPANVEIDEARAIAQKILNQLGQLDFWLNKMEFANAADQEAQYDDGERGSLPADGGPVRDPHV